MVFNWFSKDFVGLKFSLSSFGQMLTAVVVTLFINESIYCMTIKFSFFNFSMEKSLWDIAVEKRFRAEQLQREGRLSNS